MRHLYSSPSSLTECFRLKRQLQQRWSPRDRRYRAIREPFEKHHTFCSDILVTEHYQLDHEAKKNPGRLINSEFISDDASSTCRKCSSRSNARDLWVDVWR